MKKELIIQHYNNPNNQGEIKDGVTSKAENASCGDSVEVFLKIENGVITDTKFKGMGCSICLGTADILLDSIKGKRVDEVKKLPDVTPLNLIEMDEDSPRRSCALLSLQAVLSALKEVE